MTLSSGGSWRVEEGEEEGAGLSRAVWGVRRAPGLSLWQTGAASSLGFEGELAKKLRDCGVTCSHLEEPILAVCAPVLSYRGRSESPVEVAVPPRLHPQQCPATMVLGTHRVCWQCFPLHAPIYIS